MKNLCIIFLTVATLASCTNGNTVHGYFKGQLTHAGNTTNGIVTCVSEIDGQQADIVFSNNNQFVAQANSCDVQDLDDHIQLLYLDATPKNYEFKMVIANYYTSSQQIEIEYDLQQNDTIVSGTFTGVKYKVK